MKKRIIIVSGYFNPLHKGHLEYFRLAKSMGDLLYVIVNNDLQREKKGSKEFMLEDERMIIIEELKLVDKVYLSVDQDRSVSKTINKIHDEYGSTHTLYFANGGDRNKENIPEMSVDNINFVFSVGGEDKKNSSSWILKKWQYYHEERLWGSFYNLFEEQQVKVKELIVDPGKGMSFQKHFKRSEIWMVSKGSCIVNYSKEDPDKKQSVKLNKFDHYLVPVGDWHQITNPFQEACHLIEIQYGEACIEDDIERTEYYSPEK